MRYELSDYEWTAIKPILPNKPRGVRRVNDRHLLNGIFWVLRSGAPWREAPVSELESRLGQRHQPATPRGRADNALNLLPLSAA
jgi:transposase